MCSRVRVRLAVASWPEFRPTALLGLLAHAEIDFVVIGGVAVVVQANPRFTRDLDICYATDRANLERLGALLVSLTRSFVASTKTSRSCPMRTRVETPKCSLSRLARAISTSLLIRPALQAMRRCADAPTSSSLPGLRSASPRWRICLR